jgi:parallel beta-helix repeat protein
VNTGTSARISGNTITGQNTYSWSDGIRINSGSAYVYGNTIQNNSGSGISNSGSSVISDNTVSGNAGTGVYTNGGSTTIKGNTITGNSGDGVWCGASPTIVFNTITTNSGNGVYIDNGAPIINVNNIYSQYNSTTGKYDVYNNSADQVVASNVWWGTTSSATIKTHVYDYYDNSAKGKVLSLNYLSGTWATADSDADGTLDYLDTDDDNDGYTDVNETMEQYNKNPFSSASYPSVVDTSGTSLLAAGENAIGWTALNNDTTWTTAMNPVVLTQDFRVPGGITLTIDPGVEVHMSTTDGGSSGSDSSKVEFTVDGILIVNGTAQEPVVFTSDAATKSAGDWYGIVFTNTGSLSGSVVDNARIEYARYGVYANSSSPMIRNSTIVNNSDSGVYLNYSNAAIEGNILSLNANQGIYVYNNSSPTISGNTISKNGTGIVLPWWNNGMPIVRNNQIVNNINGMYVDGGNSAAIGYNTIDGNTYGIYGYLYYDASHISSVQNNIITNNVIGLYDYATSGDPALGYNDIWNNGTNYSQVDPAPTDISADPKFPRIFGKSTELFDSTLTDDSANWPADSLIGLALNPNVTQQAHFTIIGNTATSITVSGDLSAVAAAGGFYTIADDFRLLAESPAKTASDALAEIGAYGNGGSPPIYTVPTTITPTTAGVLTQDEIWDGTVDIAGDVTVALPHKLTIWKGTTVNFAADSDSRASGNDGSKSELRVDSKLAVLGTASAPVTFTSNAPLKAAGQWYGIVFSDSSIDPYCMIDNARIEYAVEGVYASSVSPAIWNSSILNNSDCGVYLNYSNAVINGNILSLNTNQGIYVTIILHPQSATTSSARTAPASSCHGGITARRS